MTEQKSTPVVDEKPAPDKQSVTSTEASDKPQDPCPPEERKQEQQ